MGIAYDGTIWRKMIILLQKDIVLVSDFAEICRPPSPYPTMVEIAAIALSRLVTASSLSKESTGESNWLVEFPTNRVFSPKFWASKRNLSSMPR